MKDNFDELKSLKEMLEQGAISKSEFEIMKTDLLKKSMAKDGVKSAQKPNSFIRFFKFFKWLIAAIIIIIISIIIIYNSIQKDPLEEANKLAKEYCNCQIQNNDEYISQINSFILDLDSSNIEYANDISTKLEDIQFKYISETINQNVSTCFRILNLKLERVESYFKKGSSDEKDFSIAYRTKIDQDINLASQNQEIYDLLNRANSLSENFCYENEDELEYRKQNIDEKMNSYYSSYSDGYIDAFDFFDYKVETYLTRKNISPTDINLIIKTPNSDYQNQKWKLAVETLKLINCIDNIETWEYASEFICYRPSKDQWQISNVIYEVKFNESDRIISYREKKVEKSQFFSTEEYSERFGQEYNYE